jgi:F-type H+-transporting ATPase subunit c
MLESILEMAPMAADAIAIAQETAADKAAAAANKLVMSGNYGPGLGAGLAAGGAAIGAGLGIGQIGGHAGTGIARQPEAADVIKGNALLMAALVEGVALFAAVIGLMLYLK